MVRALFRSRNQPPRRDVWEQFLENEELLKAHRITSDEIESPRRSCPGDGVGDLALERRTRRMADSNAGVVNRRDTPRCE